MSTSRESNAGGAALARRIEREEGGSCAASQHIENVGTTERIGSLALGALTFVAGVKTGGFTGLTLAGIGAGCVYRGVTGHCYAYEALGVNTADRSDGAVIPAKCGVKFEKSMQINASPEELYSFWRDLKNLPRILGHVESVTPLDETRSAWRVRGPLNVHAEWNAVITQDRRPELIAWESEQGSEVATAGSVRFAALGADRGTSMTVSMKYDPPGGRAAAQIMRLFGGGVEAEISADLRRFKSFMETGEWPTVAGQSHGERGPRHAMLSPFVQS